jgi:hypothetical protein
MSDMPSSGQPANGRDLQFDRAVPASQSSDAATQAVVCAACGSTVRLWYYDVGGEQYCGGCKQKLERESGSVRGWSVTLRAALYGLAAAVAGAIIYYGVIAITNFEIGIVALLIGYMVGFAVRKGANGRGGRRLQVVAAGLTYFSVALAYFPLAMKGAVEGSKVGEPAAIAVDSTLGEQETPNAAAQAELDSGLQAATADGAQATMNPVVAMGVLLAFSLALPIMVIFGTLPSGLISGLIIGIGMRQAWAMTRVADLTILGPFKVGVARPDASSAGPASHAA